MTRDEADALVADVMADRFTRLRADLEARLDRRVAEKALPPFSPPAPWTAGRHGGGTTVRHRNGLFWARRDTEGEPGVDEAWLCVVGGIAGIGVSWHDHTLALTIEQSDGKTVVFGVDLDVPIARGYWQPDADYKPGDRVIRQGEWHAARSSKNVDPSSDAADGVWLKISGKQSRGASFKVDDDGTLYENGHAIGSLKPMVAELFAKLTHRENDHGR